MCKFPILVEDISSFRMSLLRDKSFLSYSTQIYFVKEFTRTEKLAGCESICNSN